MEGWRDPSEALAAYERWLVGLPLAERTRREYARWVRLFCAWLADGADTRAIGADPLRDPRARDYAARDFKRYVKLERLSSRVRASMGPIRGADRQPQDDPRERDDS